MDPGAPGCPGPSVARPVVGEPRPGGDTVTLQLMEAETVRVMTLSSDSAILNPVQVRTCSVRPSLSINNSSGRCVGKVDVLEQRYSR